MRAGAVAATVHLSRADVPADAVRTGDAARGGDAPAGPRRHGIRARRRSTACGGPDADPAVFVCGPTSFVEAVVGLLADAGLDPRTVRAERFG